MTLSVVGIDPGIAGYACRLDTFTPIPIFFPSPVGKDGVYDFAAMNNQTRLWYGSGVRLVLLEEQAPRGHGTKEQIRFGQGREGTKHAFTLGRGFGAWECALAGAGFMQAKDDADARFLVTSMTKEGFFARNPCYLIVPPDVWKRRMGATVVSHRGEDTHHARRKAANARTIEVAKRVDPRTDFRALERTPGAKTDSPDKAASRLIAEYGLRGVLGVMM